MDGDLVAELVEDLIVVAEDLAARSVMDPVQGLARGWGRGLVWMMLDSDYLANSPAPVAWARSFDTAKRATTHTQTQLIEIFPSLKKLRFFSFEMFLTI